jgi:hypothetical protein
VTVEVKEKRLPAGDNDIIIYGTVKDKVIGDPIKAYMNIFRVVTPGLVNWYIIHVDASGYNSVTLPIQLEPGSVKEINFELIPTSVREEKSQAGWMLVYMGLPVSKDLARITVEGEYKIRIPVPDVPQDEIWLEVTVQTKILRNEKREAPIPPGSILWFRLKKEGVEVDLKAQPVGYKKHRHFWMKFKVPDIDAKYNIDIWGIKGEVEWYNAYQNVKPGTYIRLRIVPGMIFLSRQE